MPEKPTYEEMEKELGTYRDLVEYAPIGIFRSSVDGRVLHVNPCFARMFGYDSPQDYCASVENIAEDIYLHPETRDEFVDLVLEKETLPNFENRFRRKDGSVITCKLHVRAAPGRKYIEGFIEDISDQKEVAEALKESEKRYRSIFENTGTGAIIIEEDMTISLANAGFEKLTGYSKSEIEGRMKWPQIIAFPEDLEAMRRYHFQRRKDIRKAPTEYEFTLVGKRGERKNVFLKVDVIPGTRRSIASMTDLSSLVQARKSLRESESRLSGVLEAFEGFVYTCSRDFRVRYMNKKLRDFVRGDRIGSLCHKAIYGLDEPCGWCAGERVFGGETVKTEFRNPADGRWYYAVSSPVLDVDDTVSQKQAVIIDIHDRKQRELGIRAREEYLEKENLRLRTTIREGDGFGRIIGRSQPMQKVYDLILRASATNANVIVCGESGTGKELVARAVHEMSDRGEQRFVPVNCGAIPRHLLESEFFGYRKGAFTGAGRDKPGYLDHADRGVLFLDELGEIEMGMQVKLLRVLEGNGYIPVGGCEVRQSDFRIISATNRDLKKLVENGRMREDFFYRVYIIPIFLPPLRERKEDIPLLAEHFLRRHQLSETCPPLTADVMDALLRHDWPGNVRELENTIQRFVNLNRLDLLGAETESPPIRRPAAERISEHGDLPLRDAVKAFEKTYISDALARHRWNRTLCAEKLGIGRKTLYLKMKSLGIG